MAQRLIKAKKIGESVTKNHRKPEKRKAGTKGVAKHAKLQKKLTGQTIADIERIMATRAGATGKLTIMKKLAAPTPSKK